MNLEEASTAKIMTRLTYQRVATRNYMYRLHVCILAGLPFFITPNQRYIMLEASDTCTCMQNFCRVSLGRGRTANQRRLIEHPAGQVYLHVTA